MSQCTCRCVVLPDVTYLLLGSLYPRSQCTCRCVVLPDNIQPPRRGARFVSQCTCRCVVLPDGTTMKVVIITVEGSQCTCRCVVLPDSAPSSLPAACSMSLNAPAGAWCSLTYRRRHPRASQEVSQCTCRCVVLPDCCLHHFCSRRPLSQCTCRCVVLPDHHRHCHRRGVTLVSMHLQVRGAP